MSGGNLNSSSAENCCGSSGGTWVGNGCVGDTFADIGATVQRHLVGGHDPDLPGTPVI